MSVSITTSDYIKVVEAEIDGVLFKVRPMSSAQTIAWMNLAEEEEKAKAQKDTKRLIEISSKLLDSFFNLFDKPDKAREVLSAVPDNKLFEIYKTIMNDKD